MKIKTAGPNLSSVFDRLNKRADNLKTNKQLLVGVPADSGTEDSGIPIAKLAWVHEFGAEINHPGGTQYGYNTLEDAKAGIVSFQATGAGYMKLGVTKPHVIKIPERSFLRAPLKANMPKYHKAFEWFVQRATQGKISMNQALNQMGMMMVRDSQEAISKGIAPANADSTIRRKGSSTPLIDTGRLRQSITWRVVDEGEES